MEKYLGLIRRSDFTDLFKYGTIIINSKVVISFDDDLPNNDDTILYRLFENANSFESSFTYLIIEFEAPDFSSDNPLLEIENVLNIYPLDNEAKKELETSFDEHIRISSPRWSQAFFIIQNIRTKKDCEKGAKNVCRLFNIEEETNTKSIITDDILNEVVSELYRNVRPHGELPIWVYLLRYERHAFYPKETVGFFMDAVHVVCNFLNNGEVDDENVAQTSIMGVLEEVPTTAKMMEIYSYLKKNSNSARFLERIKQIDDRVDFLLVAVIFLTLKNRYQDGLVYESQMVDRFLSEKTTRESFAFASYLLGLVLGHDKTYEALYENLPLKIYKTPEEMAVIKQQKEYERWKAAEEMRRMEEELREQKGNGGGKSRSRKKKSPGFDDKTQANYGGRQNQQPFLQNYNKRNEENNEKRATQINNDTHLSETAPESIGFAPQANIDTTPGVLDVGGGNTSVHKEMFPRDSVEEIQVADNVYDSLFPEIKDEIIIPELPCMMGKLRQGSKTEWCKKTIKVETKEKFVKYYSKGWLLKQ